MLRELHDSTALLNNPLLANFLTAGTGPAGAERAALRVRAAVIAAVTSLAAGDASVHFARQRTIVTRCDLNGEKHAAVAREMGISLREFYRERRRGFERLLLAVRGNLPAPPARIRPLPSGFELELDDVANLRLIGSFGTAFDRLERLSASAPQPEDAVRALCYEVEIAAEVGDDERARRSYDAALLRAAQTRGNRRIDVHLPMAGAYVAWQTGDLATSSAQIRRASSAAATLSADAERHDLRAAMNALFARSELGVLLGDPAASLDALRAARRLLEGMRYKPADLLGQLFMEFSAVYGLVPGQHRRAIEYALESLSAFGAAGAPGSIADAAGILSGHLCASGSAGDAQRFASIAIDLARRSGSAAGLADKLLAGSLAASLAGEARTALTLAEEAAGCARSGLFALRIPLAQAQARLQLGDAAGAMAMAERAYERAASSGMLRYRGSAMRLRAEATAATGDERSARDLAAAALDMLSEHGHPASIARAHDTCVRLGVVHRGLAAAAEVRASLRLAPAVLAELLP